MPLNIDELNKQITTYFQPFFKDRPVNFEAKLSDLGFESLDYIELAAFFLKKTNNWIDISQLNNHSKISSLSSYLINSNIEKPPYKDKVILDKLSRNHVKM